MAAQRAGYLIAIMSWVVISIACVRVPLSANSEELIRVHLDSRTGDIQKVEHEFDGKVIEKQPGSFSPFGGLTGLHSFEYSVVEFEDRISPAYCCPRLGRWKSCHEVPTVIALLRYDRQYDAFIFDSLNSLQGGQLQELKTMDFDPSRRIMRPSTRSYQLAVVKSESPAGAEIWILEESKGQIWR